MRQTLQSKPLAHSIGKTSYLHESCQVGVVVIQGGNNVELNLDQDTLAQVVFVGDGCQRVEQFDLCSPMHEEREAGLENQVGELHLQNNVNLHL